MKKIFMSILLAFMLVFSVLGNVNFVKADIDNISVANINYNPTKDSRGLIIKDLQPESTQVTFRVTNNDPNRGANPVDLRITTTPAVFGQQNSLLSTDPDDIQDLEPFIINGDFEERTFTVSRRPNQDIPIGTYNGKIIVEELNNQGQVVGDPKEVDYFVIVENLNPRLSISGLNENNELIITSEEDATTSPKTVTITNSGNINLNDLNINFVGTFTDGSQNIRLKVKFNDEVNFRDVLITTPVTLIEMPDLTPASSLTVHIQAVIPADIDLATYTGSFTIADSTHNQARLQDIPLIIKIEPEICSDGRVSDGVRVDGPRLGKLKLTIDNPDRGDDFKIGDEISIEGDIENKENRDMDVIVEAILYDLDNNDKITSIESDSISVNDGEKESFDLIMIVPNDEEIDPGNTYILYIKAYEDGDEDQYCDYDGVEISLDRENDDVLIDAFTINPTVAYQGDMISFRVGVENIGTDEQKDTYITIINQELGLNLKSNLFDLKKYSKSGKDYIFTKEFTIPTTAEAKDYTIEAKVYFDREKETRSSFGTLTVKAKTPQVTQNILTTQTSFTATAGSQLTIPFTVTNTKSIQATYQVEILPTWTSSQVKTLILAPGQVLQESFSLTAGSGSAIINVKEAGIIVDTKTVNVQATQKTYTPTGASIFDNLGSTKTLFIIGDIVLVILAVLFLVLIFRKK